MATPQTLGRWRVARETHPPRPITQRRPAARLARRCPLPGNRSGSSADFATDPSSPRRGTRGRRRGRGRGRGERKSQTRGDRPTAFPAGSPCHAPPRPRWARFGCWCWAGGCAGGRCQPRRRFGDLRSRTLQSTCPAPRGNPPASETAKGLSGFPPSRRDGVKSSVETETRKWPRQDGAPVDPWHISISREAGARPEPRRDLDLATQLLERLLMTAPSHRRRLLQISRTRLWSRQTQLSMGATTAFLLTAVSAPASAPARANNNGLPNPPTRSLWAWKTPNWSQRPASGNGISFSAKWPPTPTQTRVGRRRAQGLRPAEAPKATRISRPPPPPPPLRDPDPGTSQRLFPAESAVGHTGLFSPGRIRRRPAFKRSRARERRSGPVISAPVSACRSRPTPQTGVGGSPLCSLPRHRRNPPRDAVNVTL